MYASPLAVLGAVFNPSWKDGTALYLSFGVQV